MCNRYSLSNLKALRDLLARLGVSTPEEARTRFNLPLTTRAPVVTRKAGKTALEAHSFGASLPPREPGGRPLLLGNARAETLTQRRAFKDAVRHRRCLVPADGFFEWERLGRARQPHYFHLRSREAFFFAGLWRPESPVAPSSFVIVTTAPNALLAAIHDRMPVILDREASEAWLGDQPLPEPRVAELCRPFPAALMASHRVDPAMNDARTDGPACIAPWTPPLAEPTLFD